MIEACALSYKEVCFVSELLKEASAFILGWIFHEAEGQIIMAFNGDNTLTQNQWGKKKKKGKK